ncbi:uncharacterized protein [Hetaerina americana]|uniref:uncharacterized protein isoform X2 n=1 Tax=Hetaerina americana TaxID=62018 RepID=UPI003A7F2A77
MEVRTLSAKEMKSSLSKRSSLPKKSLRKAMSSPYVSIRPICTNVSELEEIMKRLLAPAKRVTTRAPWSVLRGITKDEINAKKGQQLEDVSKGLRKQLVCGMSGVISAIENHNLFSALVSDDMEPAFMMNYIVQQATVHRVPIIILAGLRDITMEVLGFSCSCLGLKRMVSYVENPHFYPLHQKIVSIANQYELPGDITLCQCPINEPLEMHELLTPINIKKMQNMEEEELINITSREGSSERSCIYPTTKGCWKIKEEKLRKGESLRQSKKMGDELAGTNISALIQCESRHSNEDEDCKIFPNTVAKSYVSKCHSREKNPKFHPYLRTFLECPQSKMVRIQMEAKSAAETVNGKHSRIECSFDDGGNGNDSDGGSTDEKSKAVEKAEIELWI